MKTSVMLLAVILMSFMAGGCATMNTVNGMPPEIDSKVKSMQPPSEKSLVYIVRPTFLGKPFGGNVTANDEYIGTTQGGMYIYAILPPSEYLFKVTGHDSDAETTVTLEANKTYFIKQAVYPGLLKGFTSLSLVDNNEGYEALQECTLGDKLGENIAH